jgi:hypothetical protein
VLVRNYRSCREAQDRQKSGIHDVYSAVEVCEEMMRCFFPVVSEGMTRRVCSPDAVGVLSSSKFHNK